MAFRSSYKDLIVIGQPAVSDGGNLLEPSREHHRLNPSHCQLPHMSRPATRSDPNHIINLT